VDEGYITVIRDRLLLTMLFIPLSLSADETMFVKSITQLSGGMCL